MSPIQSVRHTVDRLGAHTMRVIADEDGMSTAEYSVVCNYTHAAVQVLRSIS